MFLTRTRLPMSPFHTLRRDFERLFDELNGSVSNGRWSNARPFPALNVWEDGDHLYAEAEVPGFRMKDLEILVHGNELTIKGRRGFEISDDHVFHRRERGVGEFTRVLTLPVEADADRVKAALKDGVLTVTLPKAQHARARKIEVKAAR